MRDRGDVQFAARGALVQRLDVLQDVLELPAARVDLVLRERVKHEGVVRIGRVAEGENVRFGRHGRTLRVTAEWRNSPRGILLLLLILILITG